MEQPGHRGRNRRLTVGVGCVFGVCSLALGAEITIAPTEDAFVRAAAPTLNYGGAGGLAVAGAEAVNASQQPQGRFDSVLKFDTAEAAAGFDLAFGPIF